MRRCRVSTIDALREEHQLARAQLERHLRELAQIVHDARLDLEHGLIPRVQRLPMKGETVVEATRIWEATDIALDRERKRRAGNRQGA
jgi:hypothetical protein